MALIQCNECGKEISDQAKVCPHCGAKTIKAKESKQNISKTLIIIAIIILVIAILIGIYLFMPINQYKRQAKTITNLYLNDKYTSEEAMKKLEDLSKEISEIYDETHNTNYLLLNSKITGINTDIYMYTIKKNYDSKLKIEQDLKDL